MRWTHLTGGFIAQVLSAFRQPMMGLPVWSLHIAAISHDRIDVTNHRQSSVCSRACPASSQRKHQSFTLLTFRGENPRVTDGLPVVSKGFLWTDVIMIYLPSCLLTDRYSCIPLFQAICDLWANEKLLNLVEQILGTSDIVGNPVWNLRTKTPQNEATTVPWHQG